LCCFSSFFLIKHYSPFFFFTFPHLIFAAVESKRRKSSKKCCFSKKKKKKVLCFNLFFFDDCIILLLVFLTRRLNIWFDILNSAESFRAFSSAVLALAPIFFLSVSHSFSFYFLSIFFSRWFFFLHSGLGFHVFLSRQCQSSSSFSFFFPFCEFSDNDFFLLETSTRKDCVYNSSVNHLNDIWMISLMSLC